MKQGKFSKYLENCQKLGLGVNKLILLQLLGQTISQTFMFLIHFEKNETVFL